MSDQHARPPLTTQISEFLAMAADRARRPLGSAVDPDEDVRFFEFKAALLARIADENPNDDALQRVAAGARHQLDQARKRRGLAGGDR